MIGFIQIHRQLLSWEWYGDVNTKTVFIHCLLKANWEEKPWKGSTVQRGSFISSPDKIAGEVSLTTKQVRLALDKLKRTGEVAIKGTNKYSIITLVKYDDFQPKDGVKGKQKGKQEGEQRATTKEDNNSSFKKEPKYSFRADMLNRGFDEKLIDAWLQVRKEKKAVNTEIALNGFLSQINKSRKDKNEILKICIEKSWKGFKPEWLIDVKQTQPNGKSEPYPVKRAYVPDLTKIFSAPDAGSTSGGSCEDTEYTVID